jgi:hypothetical protein
MCNCKEVKDGAEPDLIFYYDVNNSIKTVTYSDENLETRISQNTIFLDKELTIPIGNYVYNFVYGIIVEEDVNNFAIKFDYMTTQLKGGFQAANITDKQPEFIPGIIESNYETIYNIYTGSGNFLGVTGYMVFVTDTTTIRTVLVYFAK